jgi:hypothetical protein
MTQNHEYTGNDSRTSTYGTSDVMPGEREGVTQVYQNTVVRNKTRQHDRFDTKGFASLQRGEAIPIYHHP